MAGAKRILGRDEFVVMHTREHFKALFKNVLLLFIVLAAMISALIFMPENVPHYVTWIVVGIGILLILIFFGWPWLKWHTSTYTVTNRRIITRRGIISKTGHDIPLSRISNVAYEYDFIDRIFGCGTLILETSADDPLELRDVPKVEELHVQLTELLFNTASDPGAAVNELDY